MSSMETRMPHSTIRHRPIFTTPQVTPLVLRASLHQLPALSSPAISIATQGAREGDRMQLGRAFQPGHADHSGLAPLRAFYWVKEKAILVQVASNQAAFPYQS
ncbi:hypothetical protein [Dictyobacter arantiisoli]|uniref:Uncharacterized protein n=1 Tax=Dictyobacter arantiisoli TaxID=2014874 RepID=A0A5A5TI60_9CHLR|nr:hypothetical protein [Dictyobacter arantiisoli]GCF10878.1 hypothetical protein KDI_44420 [Dictyobacter arantiisoli]